MEQESSSSAAMTSGRPTPSFQSIDDAASDDPNTGSDSETETKSSESAIDEEEICRLLKKRKTRHVEIKIENNEDLPIKLDVHGIHRNIALNYTVSGITLGTEIDELDASTGEEDKPLTEVHRLKRKREWDSGTAGADRPIPCACCARRQVPCRGRILPGTSCDYCRRHRCWCSHVRKNRSRAMEPQAPARTITEEEPPQPKNSADIGTSIGSSTSQHSDNPERGRPSAQDRFQAALKVFVNSVSDIVADALEERGLSGKGNLKGKGKANE